MLLLLALAIAAMIVAILESIPESQIQTQSRIAKILLTSAGNGEVIDEEKLTKVMEMDYGSLKNEFQIKKDFCIYIEDENGNIILSKGSPSLKKDGLCAA